MKKLSLSIITLSLIVFFGCSKLKDENPTAAVSAVDPHGEGWINPASPNFHGKVIAQTGGNVNDCTRCHGTDLNGGTAESCNHCHATHHPGGTANPADANFHGKVIAANNWSLLKCQQCHGSNYAGMKLGPSCLTCHTQTNGPENCATCHGSSTSIAPPKDLAGNTSPTAPGVGAHQAHLVGGELGAKVRCSGCHVFPSSFSDPAHINTAIPGAQVRFDSTTSIALTRTNVPGTTFYYAALPTVTPNPSFTLASNSCAGTYCHGNFKNGNPANTPTWNDTTAAACGTCHGDVTKTTIQEKAMPKTILNGGIHPTATACETCHFGIIDANGNLLDKTKHINGKVNVYGTEQNF